MGEVLNASLGFYDPKIRSAPTTACHRFPNVSATQFSPSQLRSVGHGINVQDDESAFNGYLRLIADNLWYSPNSLQDPFWSIFTSLGRSTSPATDQATDLAMTTNYYRYCFSTIEKDTDTLSSHLKPSSLLLKQSDELSDYESSWWSGGRAVPLPSYRLDCRSSLVRGSGARPPSRCTTPAGLFHVSNYGLLLSPIECRTK